MAEELAALREIVNQPKKQAELKDDKLSTFAIIGFLYGIMSMTK